MSGVACPACGALTLTQEGAGEVCPDCGWSDAGEARADPAATSAGGVSLEEARVNIQRFGQAFPPSEAGGS